MKNKISSKPTVGIISWGSSIPGNAVTTRIIADSQGKTDNPGRSLGIIQKTIPQPDVDAATLAVASASDSLSKLTDQTIKQSI